MQRLITEKPFNATERLVKTTEFVLNNGGVKELLIVGRSYSITHMYNLDIIIPLVVLVFFFLYGSTRLLVSLHCQGRRKQKVN